MKKQHSFNSNVNLKTEFIAGMTSFFAISYIIIVNPIILKDAGIPASLSVFATIFYSALGCLLMYFIANAPVIITPGMGVNAFFTYTLVQSMKFTWQQALAVSAVSGLLYLIVAFTPLSRLFADAIPASLKHGITAGIGMFLVVLGLEKAQLIRSGGQRSLLALGDLSSPLVLLALFCLILTLVLYLRKVPGGFVIGIVVTSILAFILHLDTKAASSTSLSMLGSYGKLLFQTDFDGIFTVKFLVAFFS